MTTQPDPGLQPISFAFPFRDAKGKEIVDEHVLHEWLATEGSGSFAVSSSGMWHGGIHVSANGAGRHLDLPYGVRCLANGEIIAYRMNRTALASDIAAGAGQPARTGYYSSSFTLVRHTLEYPAQNRLTFFTLYMHLQSLADYQQKRMLAPAYWARCHEVTAHAADRPRAAPHQPVATTQIGLNIRAEPNGAVLGILPRGARVRIGEKKNNGRWGKIVAIESGTLIPPEAGGFVRPGAGNGWVYLGRAQGHRLLEAVVSEAQCDQIVVPPEPIPVSAGELIGHPGPYWQPDDPTRDHRMVHIEVFCGDELPGFLSASASAAQQIHDFDKLPLLRIGRGVKLFAHPSVSGEGANAPETAVVQIYSQAALDALPADSKGPKDDAYGDGQSWWKVTSANSRYDDISGWVRNRQMPPNGGVTRESPHAWKDFETVSGSDAGNPTIFRTVDAWLDHLLCEDKPATGDIGQLKPLACNVYRRLSPMRNDAHAADEMRALRDNKWLRFRASRLIPKHRSEWASQSEYQSFFEKVLTRVAAEPYHEAEMERLRNLVWWDEVQKAVKGPFPASPEVFHIHPVALVGNFGESGFRFTLKMMQRLFPHAAAQDLQEIADELNGHLKLYRLDTPLRRTHFFAQIMQETGANLNLEESFVWKASALISRFSYFRNHPAEAREHGYAVTRPIKADGTRMSRADFEAIANGAYGGRSELGNGSRESGDGWKFRGRGMKQLTGRANYRAFTAWQYSHHADFEHDELNYEENPDLLVHPKYAARSAAFFWVSNNLANLADQGPGSDQVNAITAIVNFHTDSYAARVRNFRKIWEAGDFK